MRTGAQSVLAVIALAFVLALNGCGSDGGDNGTQGEDDRHQRMLEYAQCLRDQGLDVQDPAPGEGIQLRNEGDPSRSDAAMKACEQLAPPPPPGVDEGDEREDMLEYAKCMRDKGVEKFADPEKGEGINIGPEIVEDPDFKTAEKACNEHVFGSQPDTDRDAQ